MKISEAMSIEDLVAMVFDEDDEYSWSSKSEARNAIIRKFNAAQQSMHADAACACPDDGNLQINSDFVCAVCHKTPRR